MSVYLNGQQYNGAYMNGHRVNGYINGIKMFHYLTTFTIRYAPSDDVWYSKTVDIPSDRDYNIYDLEYYGVPSAFEPWNRTFHVRSHGFTYTVDPPYQYSYQATDMWRGRLYKATGMGDPFPDIDNQEGGGNFTMYKSPVTSEVLVSRDSGGMAGDVSTIAIQEIYYSPDGTTWCFGRVDLHNSSGMGGNGSTWVGNGWVPNVAGVQLTSQDPMNMMAKLED